MCFVKLSILFSHLCFDSNYTLPKKLTLYVHWISGEDAYKMNKNFCIKTVQHVNICFCYSESEMETEDSPKEIETVVVDGISRDQATSVIR